MTNFVRIWKELGFNVTTLLYCKPVQGLLWVCVRSGLLLKVNKIALMQGVCSCQNFWHEILKLEPLLYFRQLAEMWTEFQSCWQLIATITVTVEKGEGFFMFCHSKFEVCTKNVSAQLGKLLTCLSLLSFLSLNVICDKRFLSSW